jgi:hypothetical protein
MTKTVHTSLGTSPLTGRQAVDSTQRFKELLISLNPKPKHVSLLTVQDVESQSRGVVAFYDADDACAVAWVANAKEVAGELWSKLAERRKGAVR